MPKEMGSLSIIHYVFERLCVLTLVAAYISPSSPVLWCLPLS